MFDIGFFEIFIIAVVALLVLGPEKMPHAVRMSAAYIGRIKRSLLATKIEIEDQLALEDIRKQLKAEQEKVTAMMDDPLTVKPSTITESRDNTAPGVDPKDQPHNNTKADS